jgi:hemin uptake protein HemP
VFHRQVGNIAARHEMEQAEKETILSLSGPASASRTSRCIRSKDLFAGLTRVLIEHDGAAYLLQITSQGKLLLTK